MTATCRARECWAQSLRSSSGHIFPFPPFFIEWGVSGHSKGGITCAHDACSKLFVYPQDILKDMIMIASKHTLEYLLPPFLNQSANLLCDSFHQTFWWKKNMNRKALSSILNYNNITILHAMLLQKCIFFLNGVIMSTCLFLHPFIHSFSRRVFHYLMIRARFVSARLRGGKPYHKCVYNSPFFVMVCAYI